MSTANIVGWVLIAIPFVVIFCGILFAMWLDMERKYGAWWASWSMFAIVALVACIVGGSILISL